MTSRRLLLGCLLAGAGLCVGVPANAQDGPFVEATAELSPVRIGEYASTWRAGRLAAGVQNDGRFGWNASAERYQRGDLVDWTFQTAGFQRAGAWTWGGSVGYANAPHFLYHRSFEAELSRRVVGGFVAQAGYRYLEFPSTTVRIVEPGASWYFSRGEIGAQGFLVRNQLLPQESSAVLVRSAVSVSPRVTLSGGAAVGARIFDVDTFGHGSHDAWQAFGSMKVRASSHWTLELVAGGAHEDPLFAQQSVATRVRWGF